MLSHLTSALYVITPQITSALYVFTFQIASTFRDITLQITSVLYARDIATMALDV